jgi:hypothetical protein
VRERKHFAARRNPVAMRHSLHASFAAGRRPIR